MPPTDDKLAVELKRLVEQGAGILSRAQSLPSAMPGEEVADVSSWVTRLGQLVTKLYGEKSQQFSAYKSAVATQNFYYLHSNWNAHIAQLLGVAKSAVHDLEQGLLPSQPLDGHPTIKLTAENGVWWFFQNCTNTVRWWMLTVGFAILSSLLILSYRLGRADFFKGLSGGGSVPVRTTASPTTQDVDSLLQEFSSIRETDQPRQREFVVRARTLLERSQDSGIRDLAAPLGGIEAEMDNQKVMDKFKLAAAKLNECRKRLAGSP